MNIPTQLSKSIIFFNILISSQHYYQLLFVIFLYVPIIAKKLRLVLAKQWQLCKKTVGNMRKICGNALSFASVLGIVSKKCSRAIFIALDYAILGTQ